MAHEEEKSKNPSEHQATFSGRPAKATSTGSLPSGKVLAPGKQQFVISPRRVGAIGSMAVQPLAFNFIEQTLRNSPDVEVVDIIGPRGLVGTLADGMAGPPTVIVAKMTPQNAQNLSQQGRGELIVEPDHPLTLAAAVLQQPALVLGATPVSSQTQVTVVVVGPDNNPLEGAEVYVFGSLLPATGVTDQRGQATLTLFGDTPQSVRGIYVKPKSDYWSFYQPQPLMDTRQPNICVVKPLSSTLPNFPRQQVTGWGQKAMRLDQLPHNYRGQGVRIAVVDSGAATTHSDLGNIKRGFDFVNKRTNANSWDQDAIAHGSHCAGVIAGDADNGTGIRGFAPDAEIHICKVFPGGQISSLIDALEYCIEHQIDVINLSLGSSEPSEILEQHLLRAKRLGIACIVAAGNSGGPVQYPASSPNVLAVAAIGKLGEFPQDSYHTQTVSGIVAGAGGYFFPRFTAFGPEIGVCGPGVAILSSVPPDNYAVWDGTSMAAPHITGLAALVLAHHPDFQGAFKARDARRVDALFQVLKSSAQPVSMLDPRRGIPDALIALALAPPYHAAFQNAAAMPFSFAPSWLPNGLPAAGGYAQAPYLWPQSWVDNILGPLSGQGASAAGRPWF